MTHKIMSRGNTNKLTGKCELPPDCVKRKCPDGRFDSEREMAAFCDIGRPIKGIESIKKFVQRYDPDRVIEVD